MSMRDRVGDKNGLKLEVVECGYEREEKTDL